MAGMKLLLLTLYEYSPLFHIVVVSLCFLLTAAIVLGWFGFDVPVMLLSSDETEPVTPTPERPMVQETNPFSLALGSGPASVSDGVSLKLGCLGPCVLSCFWGCEVSALQRALHNHQQNLKLTCPQHFLEALHLHFHYHQMFRISRGDEHECHTCIPHDQSITDFGPLPRKHYPLVAVLTLAETEARNLYNIVASVIVIHIPDDIYRLSARILFQYLLTSQGDVHELKPLFMSAETSGPPDLERSCQPEETQMEGDPLREETDWSEHIGRNCVVCQNAAVNRVLLPCRHACVCDSCMLHFQHCPICRAFVMESFALRATRT
ncbi:cell growth regulator with RING finger domain protein 1 [Cyprinodon tularosa]|uniref:Cell growth regulator with ring finger domain 1 n=1 Tax=Cyprinodon variegatus TaxID=28743 RepID=A0A3Q2G0P4_CYPVA|nr:PREDICTED: cell growth regulator with RING finger domain protein 1 [Cyprinodon variegatus]XP_038126466.1 cell growth regulator with RING finger domain protein 1 [Cyprinodon tularosa]